MILSRPIAILPIDLRHARVDARVLLGLLERAVRAAHHLDQVVVGDDVARLAVDDVVEARLRAALVADALEEQQRVVDAPAGVGVDPDVLLVLGRDLVRVAVPLEPALVEGVHVSG